MDQWLATQMSSNLDMVYNASLSFFKGLDSKSGSDLSYDAKNRLVALTEQINRGPLAEQRDVEPIGYLDLIGHARREAWKSLGQMTAGEAKNQFVTTLSRHSADLMPFLRDQQSPKLNGTSSNGSAVEDAVTIEAAKVDSVAEGSKDTSDADAKLREALNLQTLTTFRSYVERQHPDDKGMQAKLLAELQTKHYYMYLGSLKAQTGNDEMRCQREDSGIVCEADLSTELKQDEGATKSDGEQPEFAMSVDEPILTSSSDVSEFKACVRSAELGGNANGSSQYFRRVMSIPAGHAIIVKVPVLTVPQSASQVQFRFATDSHDISFGLSFEWIGDGTTKMDEQCISIETIDADSDEDEETVSVDSCVRQDKFHTDLVDLMRRNCQNFVYEGRHIYPMRRTRCEGVIHGSYVLIFDNSYSMWRSKTLYLEVSHLN